MTSHQANHSRRSRGSALEALREETRGWAARIGVNPRRIQVQVMRKKWASCSTAGSVTLSRDLLLEQAEFRTFVIVHELLHLQVPNHGRLFRNLMRAFIPGWEQLAAGKVARSCGFQKLPADLGSTRLS